MHQNLDLNIIFQKFLGKYPQEPNTWAGAYSPEECKYTMDNGENHTLWVAA